MFIEFTVLGHPKTAGSKKSFPFHKKTGGLGVRVTDDNTKTKVWQHEVKAAASEVFKADILREPIEVTMTFVVPRPKSHFRSGKNSSLLRDGMPIAPPTRPDVLKLARAVEDALTGIIWHDDAQIVSEVLNKRYGEPARCEVVVSSGTDMWLYMEHNIEEVFNGSD